MTLPSFKSVGTGHETAPAWPTHVAGDFALLLVETDSETGIVNPPTGWSADPQSPSIANNASRIYAFYRYATSSSESAPTIATAGDHAWGVVITFENANTVTPIHKQACGANPGNTTTPSFPGLTTLIDDCLIVICAAWAADNAGPLFSGETNSSLANLTERYDAGTVTGNGGGLVILTGEKATKGAVLQTTGTWGTSTSGASFVIALQGSQKSFGKKSRIVNAGM